MTIRILGKKPNDRKFKKMKNIWDACRDGGIEPPEEVKRFFGDQAPSPDGVVVDLTQTVLVRTVMQAGLLSDPLSKPRTTFSLNMSALATAHPDLESIDIVVEEAAAAPVEQP